MLVRLGGRLYLMHLAQGRREKEEEYKDRMNVEMARLQDAIRTQDAIRNQVKEVEVKMARSVRHLACFWPACWLFATPRHPRALPRLRALALSIAL